jgi:hypothetical protein
MMSTEEPLPELSTMVMGFVGKFWAEAAPIPSDPTTASTAIKRLL